MFLFQPGKIQMGRVAEVCPIDNGAWHLYKISAGGGA